MNTQLIDLLTKAANSSQDMENALHFAHKQAIEEKNWFAEHTIMKQLKAARDFRLELQTLRECAAEAGR